MKLTIESIEYNSKNVIGWFKIYEFYSKLENYEKLKELLTNEHIWV